MREFKDGNLYVCITNRFIITIGRSARNETADYSFLRAERQMEF